MGTKKPTWSHYFETRKANILDIEKFRRFALFVPFIQKNGEWHILFEVRAQNVPQPGDVCFPGGKVDADDPTEKDAAIRELCEELGVKKSNVHLIGELDYMLTAFGLILYPYIGVLDEDASFNINQDEVKEIFTVPLSALKKMEPKKHHVYLKVKPEDEFPFHLIPNGENYEWRTGVVNEQFYGYDGYTIWGLTARILTHVLEEIELSENN
ncbi:CoA pyrophosphatase [Bacillus shivajii]|uniref:NUDIX hydrolase n=1 Tax=Bacillus shivajii TaxID=1983719 RepID=UPI001CFBE65F|nr:CoA pyrophosphatase [Bacillus shivajii]UCZ54404.1 CoA pyrophosphatase [Bacillus shivajii]